MDIYIQKDINNQNKKVYQINPDYVLRKIGGEYAIIPTGDECLINNAVMIPNTSAVFIWKAFLEPTTEEEVLYKILKDFDGPEDIIKNDIHRFVVESLNCKVLREVN